MLKLFRASRANRDLRRAIKSILGFCPGNIFLYRLAFRHRSASKVLNGVRRNNERLEYLGDAVLSVVIAEYLFKKYPTQDEGFLTEMRSKIVSRASLNKVGLHMGLHKMIQLDQGHGSGGFKSVDGDALEALIGAIFLDKGFKFTKKIILRRIVDMHMDVDELERKDWNYKSKLIDWCQKERKKVDFRVESTTRQGGKKLYKVEVRVDGEVWAASMEHSVKSAEQLAAENAYKKVVDPWLVSHAHKHAHLADDMEAEKQRLKREKAERQRQQRKKAEEAAAVAAAIAMQAVAESETVEAVVAPQPEAEPMAAGQPEMEAEAATQPEVDLLAVVKPETEAATQAEIEPMVTPLEAEPVVLTSYGMVPEETAPMTAMAAEPAAPYGERPFEEPALTDTWAAAPADPAETTEPETVVPVTAPEPVSEPMAEPAEPLTSDASPETGSTPAEPEA